MTPRRNTPPTAVHACLALLSLTMAGCVTGGDDSATPDSGGCDAAPTARETPTAEMEAAARSANQLGLGLLRVRTDEDAFLAPMNIATALGMALAGAGGTTADEMRTVLASEGTDDALHAGLAGVGQTLAAASGTGDPACPTWTFSGANAAFLDARFTIDPAYAAVLADPYGVAPQVVDYATDPAGAADAINAWASENTGGHIDAIANADDYDSTTMLLLASAVYFQGDWAEAFDVDSTSTRGFTRADGTVVDVPMMDGTARRRAGAIDGASIVELPYRGDDLQMILVVPDAVDGLDSVLATMDPSAIDPLSPMWFSPGQVEVEMPRFEVRSHASLRDPLVALGMPTAFDHDAADFNGMGSPPASADVLFIDDVVHEAWVKVDESGTTAAAATTVEVGADTASMPLGVYADHPFLYVIRDSVTGAWLFAGRMDVPPAE